MPWYKSWLETRWRFLIGLVLLGVAACGIVLDYPQAVKLLAAMPNSDPGGSIGRESTEAIALSRDLRSWVWWQWFGQNGAQLGTLFAALLGSGSPLSQGSGGAALFTLSLPVTRTQWLRVRAATGLAELLGLALVPSLLIPLLAPVVGQTYGVGTALIHGLCLFIASSMFFSLACLLSTVFSGVWRPLLIAFCAAAGLGLIERIFRDVLPSSMVHVVSAELYFRGGRLPWLGLFASAAVSVALLYAAARNIARQDF